MRLLPAASGCWKDLALYLSVLVLPWPFLYPALGFRFASDDLIMIVENQYMRDPGNWWRMVSTDAFDRTIEGFEYEVRSPVGHWRPINKLSYLSDYSFWGPRSDFFHLSGILLHLGAGLIVAYLGRLLGFSRPAAALSALLFVLHPLAAKPVGLVSIRADLWCALFAFAAIAFALRAERGGKPWAVFSYLSAFLSLLGKETGLFLPLFFGLYFLFRNREGPRVLRRTLYQVWPYCAAVGLYALVRFGIFAIATGHQNDFPQMDAWSLFMSLSRLAFSYISETAAPLLVDHLWLPEILRGFPDATVLLSWLGLGGMGFAAWRLWRGRRPRAVLAFLLLCLPILPLLNIYAISGEDVGELLPFEAHRVYIPLAGFALLWGMGLSGAAALRGWSRPLRAALLLLPLGYAALFPGELAAYRDTESMVRHKLREVERLEDEELPLSLRLTRLNMQGIEMKRQKKYGQARALFEKMLELYPYDAIALKNLAIVAMLQKDPERVIDYLETVLKPLPYRAANGSVRMVIDDPQLRHTGAVQRLLGHAYQMEGQYEKAREHLKLALKIDPSDPTVVIMLAWNAATRRDTAAARLYLRRFLRQARAADPRRAFALRKLQELE